MDKFLIRTAVSQATGDETPSSSTNKADYEKKRKRTFQNSWKKEFTWLLYDEAKHEMSCAVCKQFPRICDLSNAFVVGLGAFRKDSIKAHDRSIVHKKCVSAKLAETNPDQTPMGKAIARMNKTQFEVMTKLFRTAYFIAKEELPLRKFSSFCRLQVANGIELNGDTYLNSHACKAFIHAISHTENENIVDLIKKCRFLSVMSDGSTDSGVVEQEIVYVRFVQQNGIVFTKMIQSMPVQHAHAQGVLQAIDGALAFVGVDEDAWVNKVVCANFDGASVMMGSKTGVAARLKQRIPHIITIHCVAHRLELVVLDAVKNSVYLETFEDTLKSIFKLYYYSTKKRRELETIGNLLEEKVAHFSGLKSTRWLPSRLRCLKAVQQNYAITVTHMENMASNVTKDVKPEDAAKAKGIVLAMKTEKFVNYLYFMLDYSSTLSKCSENLQYDDLNITRTSQLIKSATSDLLKLKAVEGGGSYQKILKGKLIRQDNESGENQVLYDGICLTKEKRPQRTHTEDGAWESEFTDIIDNTVTYLDKRFKNLFEKPLSCFSVLDTSHLPRDREALAIYGNNEIEDLVLHFAEVLTAEEREEIPHEWSDLKVWLCVHRGQKLHTLYADLLCESPPHLKNVLVIINLLLTLSPSTAICERGFSCMNRVKTCYRTGLKSETLNDLMQISTNGPDVDKYSTDKAINHWFFSGKGSRHLTHKTPIGGHSGQQRPSMTNDSDTDEPTQVATTSQPIQDAEMEEMSVDSDF